MSHIAIIPARGGSKRLPRKNIRDFCGRPLIDWTISAALESSIYDKIIVSSDDDEILDRCSKFKDIKLYKRPQALAQDHSTSIDVVFDCLASESEVTWVSLLQPTSPLRTSDDIRQAWALIRDSDAFSLVSVVELKYHSGLIFNLDTPSLHLNSLTKLSNVKKDYRCYFLNGAIYISKIAQLREYGTFLNPDSIGYEMPEIRSPDIDTPADWALAEIIKKLNS